MIESTRAQAIEFANKHGVEVVIYDARFQGAPRPSYCYARATAKYVHPRRIVERIQPANN